MKRRNRRERIAESRMEVKEDSDNLFLSILIGIALIVAASIYMFYPAV